MDTTPDNKEHRNHTLYWALCASALVHAAVLLIGKLTEPDPIPDKSTTPSRVNLVLKPPAPVPKLPSVTPHPQPSIPPPPASIAPEVTQPEIPQSDAAPNPMVSTKNETPERQAETHGTVFDPRLRKQLRKAQDTPDYAKYRQPAITTFTDVSGRTVLKQGRYCSAFQEGVDETDPGLWTLPYKCDSRVDESQRIKKALSDTLREYRDGR